MLFQIITVGKNPKIVTGTKPCINKYKWERINFPLEKDDYSAYVSKQNSNCEKQVILLMIPNGEGREAKSKGR